MFPNKNARIKHEHHDTSYENTLKELYGDRFYPKLGGGDGTVKDFTIQDLSKLVDSVGYCIIIDCDETDIYIDIYDDYIE